MNHVNPKTVYKPSKNIVAREIEGELILIAITAGVGDVEEGMFTLNVTARKIWQLFDGKKELHQIIHEIADIYDAPEGKIEKDVNGLVTELANRNMIVRC